MIVIFKICKLGLLSDTDSLNLKFFICLLVSNVMLKKPSDILLNLHHIYIMIAIMVIAAL